jgi:GntR family transcriptional regulator/MocR family aminotransferase
MRLVYMELRKAIVNAIRREIGNIVDVIGAEAGMPLVALLPRGVKDKFVSDEPAREDISIMPLSACHLTPHSGAD